MKGCLEDLSDPRRMVWIFFQNLFRLELFNIELGNCYLNCLGKNFERKDQFIGCSKLW